MCLRNVDVDEEDHIYAYIPRISSSYGIPVYTYGEILKSLFRRKERGDEVLLRVPQEVLPLIRDYAEKKNMSIEDALHDLIVKGYRYYQLETMYDKHVSDREVWDRRFYFLKIEAGYLYYRMRLRDAIEDLRSLAMILSGTISSLEMCYKRCLQSVDGGSLNEIKRLRQIAEYYLQTYVLNLSRELEEKKYANDEEILHSIEETVAKYRRLFLEKRYEEKQRVEGSPTRSSN